MSLLFFFFNDTATTEIYTLSLHDALPISLGLAILYLIAIGDKSMHTERDVELALKLPVLALVPVLEALCQGKRDRKSTRLNSSHLVISYAVFCLKKKQRRQTGHSIPTTPL